MVTPYELPTQDILYARQTTDSPICPLGGCGVVRQTLTLSFTLWKPGCTWVLHSITRPNSQWKYNDLCQTLRQVFPDYLVVVYDFIIGVRGSLREDRLVYHIVDLSVGRGEQNLIMTLATQGSVEGS